MTKITFENLTKIKEELLIALTAPYAVVKLTIKEDAKFTGEENSIAGMDLVTDSYTHEHYGRLLSFDFSEDAQDFKNGRREVETSLNFYLDDKDETAFEVLYINGEVEPNHESTEAFIEVISELKPPF